MIQSASLLGVLTYYVLHVYLEPIFLLPMSQKLSSACVHSDVKMIQSDSLNETFTVRQLRRFTYVPSMVL